MTLSAREVKERRPGRTVRVEEGGVIVVGYPWQLGLLCLMAVSLGLSHTLWRRLDDEFNEVVKCYKRKVGEVMEDAKELNKQMDALIALRFRVDNPAMGSRTSEVMNLAANGKKPGMNLITTIIGFGMIATFIVFVCFRLICGRIRGVGSRQMSEIESRIDLEQEDLFLHTESDSPYGYVVYGVGHICFICFCLMKVPNDQYVQIGMVSGLPVSVNGKEFSPASLLSELNEIGGHIIFVLFKNLTMMSFIDCMVDPRTCINVTPCIVQLGKTILNVSPGSSNASGSSSSKEQHNQQYPVPEVKCRKRHQRKHFENQKPCLMRGVYFKNMKWQAAIKVDKKQIYLGTVGSQEAAARLYDRSHMDVIQEAEMSTEGNIDDEVRPDNEPESSTNYSKAGVVGFRPPSLKVLNHVKINVTPETPLSTLPSLKVLNHVKINVTPETPLSTLKTILMSSKSDLSFSKGELRKVEEQMRQAFIEFYQKLLLLKSCCLLNLLAFSKIMKKYAKVSHFYHFKECFEGLLGDDRQILALMSLFGFIDLHMIMFSGNNFWRHFRVNYAFIFGFKKGMELGYREVLLVSSGLAVLTLAGVISNLDMDMDPRTGRSFRTTTELVPLGLVTRARWCRSSKTTVQSGNADNITTVTRPPNPRSRHQSRTPSAVASTGTKISSSATDSTSSAKSSSPFTTAFWPSRASETSTSLASLAILRPWLLEQTKRNGG
ncbi:hypothetical protein TEA_021186 [Camellia sinensis var. sinensis]|uniref:SPX domain-containing protein n=1 Tax=Camellia sinensis var. sinensis TaxID=542762 RepID=A0A4S4DIT8_CAMSN|nr:hypothetical protein TEA_021186 [Camellia sinensis var. sinensis]